MIKFSYSTIDFYSRSRSLGIANEWECMYTGTGTNRPAVWERTDSNWVQIDWNDRGYETTGYHKIGIVWHRVGSSCTNQSKLVLFPRLFGRSQKIGFLVTFSLDAENRIIYPFPERVKEKKNNPGKTPFSTAKHYKLLLLSVIACLLSWRSNFGIV